MATKIYTIERLVRQKLDEPMPRFWSSDEITQIIIAGIKDLWRDVVNLKQEHFMTINTSVSIAAEATSLSSVPTDIHKILLIEPADLSTTTAYSGLSFRPLEYNDPKFQAARAQDSQDPSGQVVYYAITGAGSPVGAPTIRVAPKLNSAVTLALSYVPTVETLTAQSNVPIPGEVDNALVAWAMAYARAKENENRTPDPEWLMNYEREKQHILQSLGVRQHQEDQITQALFEDLW